MAQKKPKRPMTEADRRQDILNRMILKNDKTAVPEFRKLLRQVPNIADSGGNLAKIAEETLVKGIAGDQLWMHEMLLAKLKTMRTELAGPQPSPIERLLVERVVACWLQVYDADAIAAQPESVTFVQGDYNQRRQDRAHRRYLSAIRTLAMVRKLALPIRVDLNVAGSIETKETQPAPASHRGRRAEPAGRRRYGRSYASAARDAFRGAAEQAATDQGGRPIADGLG